jgi:hypothetical protein
MDKISSKTVEKSSALKFPYPVLNDKRDYKTILNILTTKESELSKKLKHAKISYKKTDDDKKKEKLKTLYKNIKSQLPKIEKQIEYVKINVRIKKIEKLREKKKENDYKKEQYDELTSQLSRLTFFMKEANHSFLAESKLQQKKINSSSTVVNENKNINDSLSLNDSKIVDTPQASMMQTGYYGAQQNMIYNNQWTPGGPSSSYHLMPPSYPPQQPYYHSPVVVAPQQPQPPKLNENYISDPVKLADYIQNTLAIAIVQTAAAAHAHAAITSVAMNPPPPPPENPAEPVSVLPTKFEIEKASTTFENYKAKIKFLLERDKNIVKPTNSLKTLISAYKNDDEEEEDEEEENEPMVIGDKDNNDDDNDDAVYSSDDSDTDIDIILTSNSKNLNFVIPPSNKIYGIQASLQNNLDKYSLIDQPKDLIYEKNTKPSLLIAQSSAFSVTCMGCSSILTKNSSLKNILYKKFNKVK